MAGVQALLARRPAFLLGAPPPDSAARGLLSGAGRAIPRPHGPFSDRRGFRRAYVGISSKGENRVFCAYSGDGGGTSRAADGSIEPDIERDWVRQSASGVSPSRSQAQEQCESPAPHGAPSPPAASHNVLVPRALASPPASAALALLLALAPFATRPPALALAPPAGTAATVAETSSGRREARIKAAGRRKEKRAEGGTSSARGSKSAVGGWEAAGGGQAGDVGTLGEADAGSRRAEERLEAFQRTAAAAVTAEEVGAVERAYQAEWARSMRESEARQARLLDELVGARMALAEREEALERARERVAEGEAAESKGREEEGGEEAGKSEEGAAGKGSRAGGKAKGRKGKGAAGAGGDEAAGSVRTCRRAVEAAQRRADEAAAAVVAVGQQAEGRLARMWEALGEAKRRVHGEVAGGASADGEVREGEAGRGVAAMGGAMAVAGRDVRECLDHPGRVPAVLLRSLRRAVGGGDPAAPTAAAAGGDAGQGAEQAGPEGAGGVKALSAAEEAAADAQVLAWHKWAAEQRAAAKKQIVSSRGKAKAFAAEKQAEVLAARDRVMGEATLNMGVTSPLLGAGPEGRWELTAAGRWELTAAGLWEALSHSLLSSMSLRHDRRAALLRLKADPRLFFVDLSAWDSWRHATGGTDELLLRLRAAGVPTRVEVMWVPVREWDPASLYALPARVVGHAAHSLSSAGPVQVALQWYVGTAGEAAEETFFRFVWPAMPRPLKALLKLDYSEGAAAGDVVALERMGWLAAAERRFAKRSSMAGRWAWWLVLPAKAAVALFPLRWAALPAAALAQRLLVGAPGPESETAYKTRLGKELLRRVGKQEEDEEKAKKEKKVKDSIREAFDRMKRVRRPAVRLSDFAGMDAVKEEVQEVITFLRDPSSFQRLGARPPRPRPVLLPCAVHTLLASLPLTFVFPPAAATQPLLSRLPPPTSPTIRAWQGVLITGGSGVGKSSLALAIAAEARVPVVDIKSGDVDPGGFVGQGAANVRELFKMAREMVSWSDGAHAHSHHTHCHHHWQAPMLILMEDFEEIGGVRGAAMDTRLQDKEAIINQLLVELDGFETQEGVVLLAITDNPAAVDPALRRPGRMDRVIEVPLPTAGEREKILRRAAAASMDQRFVDAVDWRFVAEQTGGLKPTDLRGMPRRILLAAGTDKFRDEDELAGTLSMLEVRHSQHAGGTVEVKLYHWVVPALLRRVPLLQRWESGVVERLGLELTPGDVQRVLPDIDFSSLTDLGMDLTLPDTAKVPLHPALPSLLTCPASPPMPLAPFASFHSPCRCTCSPTCHCTCSPTCHCACNQAWHLPILPQVAPPLHFSTCHPTLPPSLLLALPCLSNTRPLPSQWDRAEKLPHAVWAAGRGVLAALLPSFDRVDNIWLNPNSWEVRTAMPWASSWEVCMGQAGGKCAWGEQVGSVHGASRWEVCMGQAGGKCAWGKQVGSVHGASRWEVCMGQAGGKCAWGEQVGSVHGASRWEVCMGQAGGKCAWGKQVGSVHGASRWEVCMGQAGGKCAWGKQVGSVHGASRWEVCMGRAGGKCAWGKQVGSVHGASRWEVCMGQAGGKCAWGKQVGSVHGVSRWEVCMGQAGGKCAWGKQVGSVHGVSRWEVCMGQAGGKCAWGKQVGSVHGASRWEVCMGQAGGKCAWGKQVGSVHGASRWEVCMGQAGGKCAWGKQVGSVHGASRWEVCMGQAGGKCAWGKQVGSVHGASRWEVCMGQAGGKCAWGKQVGSVHGASRWEVCMGQAGGKCAWGKQVGSVHGASRWEVCMGQAGGKCAWGKQVGGVHGASRWEVCMGQAGGKCAWGKQVGGVHGASRWEVCMGQAGGKCAWGKQVGSVHGASRWEVCMGQAGGKCAWGKQVGSVHGASRWEVCMGQAGGRCAWGKQGVGFTRFTRAAEGSLGGADGSAEAGGGGVVSRAYTEQSLVALFGSHIAAALLLPWGHSNNLATPQLQQAYQVAERMVMEWGWGPDDSPFIFQTHTAVSTTTHHAVTTTHHAVTTTHHAVTTTHHAVTTTHHAVTTTHHAVTTTHHAVTTTHHAVTTTHHAVTTTQHAVSATHRSVSAALLRKFSMRSPLRSPFPESPFLLCGVVLPCHPGLHDAAFERAHALLAGNRRTLQAVVDALCTHDAVDRQVAMGWRALTWEIAEKMPSADAMWVVQWHAWGLHLKASGMATCWPVDVAGTGTSDPPLLTQEGLSF
ncbi:unnamed protein product [Closterium sp. Naga37s-1]|nr:unnamed protein product [Closterium sp. Naga37s-1]